MTANFDETALDSIWSNKTHQSILYNRAIYIVFCQITANNDDNIRGNTAKNEENNTKKHQNPQTKKIVHLAVIFWNALFSNPSGLQQNTN